MVKDTYQEIFLKVHPVSCTYTHHDVTDLVNHGMVKNTGTWISWGQNMNFLWNKKILNLCLGWCILRSYHFVVEVTFKSNCRTSQLKFLKSNCRTSQLYVTLMNDKVKTKYLVGRELFTSLFYKDLSYNASTPFFKFCSTTLPHALLLNDIMDLILLSLGTIVAAAAPCCVLYATGHWVYWKVTSATKQ